MTQRDLRTAADHATAAAASLIPAASGGRDGDGRQVVDVAEAIRNARRELRAALEALGDEP